MNKVGFGRAGEDVACKYLMKNNYEIIERNFYFKGGEIDIIAFDKNKYEVVFFEVKTRKNTNYGLPSEAVDTKKVKHIKRGIKIYLHNRKWENKFIRVDVLELLYRENKFYINHLKQVI